MLEKEAQTKCEQNVNKIWLMEDLRFINFEILDFYDYIIWYHDFILLKYFFFCRAKVVAVKGLTRIDLSLYVLRSKRNQGGTARTISNEKFRIRDRPGRRSLVCNDTLPNIQFRHR